MLLDAGALADLTDLRQRPLLGPVDAGDHALTHLVRVSKLGLEAVSELERHRVGRLPGCLRGRLLAPIALLLLFSLDFLSQGVQQVYRLLGFDLDCVAFLEADVVVDVIEHFDLFLAIVKGRVLDDG